ncbi:MAG: tetratricopeptide repeat protein, partial [Candidatus Eisenbacteria bacterium]|nr:tetratricopeptide repeat protein [Candidatus Latescibacterota bacterium]MBD3302045.1 tetratricopeptide repeat protein [Candidatus Eisenbacteria bacterium]
MPNAANSKSPERVGIGPFVGLLLIGSLAIAGRFLPPTLAWGFHHTAYVPLWAWGLVAAGWVAVLVPAFRRSLLAPALESFGDWLFRGSILRPVFVAVLCAGLFLLLRVRTHLLGDGILIGELVARGASFRAHDAMDYLIHLHTLKALGRIGDGAASFRLYQAGSILAGFLAVLLAGLLLRRTRLNVSTRALAFLLWLVAAPTLLYCGYVESYGFFSVMMLGFLWSGAMAQRGELPPWVPGLLYGFAFFFHTTALFAAPALLWLALRPGPKRIARRSWALLVLGPAVLGPLLAVGFHLAAGYNEAWLRKEFLDSKNQRTVLINLTGSHGLFSFVHWKDLANWLLLVVPVTGLLIAARVRVLRSRLREPDLAFLLVQVACFLIPFLLLDRKLGAARDWDLLTPQVAGFAWMAARLWERGDGRTEAPVRLPALRASAVWIALLLVAPWIAVNASTERSLARFAEVKADYARHPRSYATEELAKYYRDHGDLEKALRFYEQTVAIFPHNARTRILLGTSYLALDRIDEARAQYDEALEIDPENWLALDMRAKLALREQDYETALPLYRKLTPKRPSDAMAWAGHGFAAYHQQRYEEAYEAFARSVRLQADPRILYYAGLSAGSVGRFDAAIRHLRRAVEGGGPATGPLYA